MERNARLSRFTGASAISSDAYFNRAQSGGPEGASGGGGGGGANMGGGGGGGPRGQGQYGQDMDLTAAELVNRLSFHVSLLEGGLHAYTCMLTYIRPTRIVRQ